MTTNTTEAQHASVLKNGTSTFLARVVGASGTLIQQTDIATLAYTVYLMDENNVNGEVAVIGHDNISLTAQLASIVFNTPQTTDPRWNAARLGGGYNFLYTIDVSTQSAFALRGRRYLVRFTFRPASGQAFHVEFLLSVR
jgi:hypothetical protein